jgi:hypothetical protein
MQAGAFRERRDKVTVVAPSRSVSVTMFLISSGQTALNGARLMPQFSFASEFSQAMRSGATIST